MPSFLLNPSSSLCYHTDISLTIEVVFVITVTRKPLPPFAKARPLKLEGLSRHTLKSPRPVNKQCDPHYV